MASFCGAIFLIRISIFGIFHLEADSMLGSIVKGVLGAISGVFVKMWNTLRAERALRRADKFERDANEYKEAYEETNEVRDFEREIRDGKPPHGERRDDDEVDCFGFDRWNRLGRLRKRN
jgi:hypothetical protein